MPWPSPQDYREAIQNPLLCFNDPELRSGKPDEDMLGLPRPISGNFASVYRMHCGQRDLAVKCFFRDIPDQQQRYAEISRHLAHARLPYTVDFDFLAQGIKVQGKWYPILKMGWISGDALDTYIQKHLSDPSRLFELAKRWLVLIKSLKEASIAHGDLQHGNVLVVNDDLKIIDYDGMFVPSLQGKASHELGHPNYQHPQRTAFDFGPELDNFSAWSIYTCLVALGADPSLWSTIPDAGDDCLLFRKEDFATPQASATLSRLTGHFDPRVQVLSSLFESIVYLSPRQIPSLDGNALQPLSSATPITAPKPAWLHDHIPLTQSNSASAQPQVNVVLDNTLPAGSASWVLDFIDPPQLATPRTFDSSFAIPRVIAIIAVLAIPGLSTFVLPIHIAGVAGLLLVDQLVLLVSYRRTPVVIEKRSILMRQKTELREMDSVKKRLRESEKTREKMQGEEDGKRSTILNQRTQLHNNERNEQDRIQAILKSAIDSINNRRQKLGRDESAALSNLQADIGARVSRIDMNISTIDLAQQDELSGSKQKMQRQYISNYLRGYTIQDANIYGIGQSLKYSLRQYGFVTAEDVDQLSVQRIPGIGATKAATIGLWKQRLVNEAFSQMPTSLPAYEIDRIESKYRQQRENLTNQRQVEQSRLNAEVTAIRSHYAALRQPLDVEQSFAQDKADRDRKTVVDRNAQDHARLLQQLSLLEKEYAERYSKLDEDMAPLRKQLLQHGWELAKIQRDLTSFASISYKRYLRVASIGERGS